jgi:hypothetical protein
MQLLIGTFKAKAATLYLGLGAIPDEIEILNLTDRTGHLWTPRMGLSSTSEERYGLALAAAGTRAASANAAAGITSYAGGDKMTAASTAYLVLNTADQRKVDVGAGYEITRWTLGSATNKTGNFDADATGATIGPGSKIVIGGTRYEIVALTAGQGISANEVTLDGAPASNDISYISSRFDYTGAASGVVIPPGIAIGASATVNDTDGDLCQFRALVA